MSFQLENTSFFIQKIFFYQLILQTKLKPHKLWDFN